SPVKHPEKVNMVIFRENTEDIYAGIEYAGGTVESQKILDFVAKEFPKEFKKIRFGTRPAAEEFWNAVGAKGFPSDVKVGIGIKPVSYSGSVRLIHTAIGYAIKFKRKSVTIVHKGNIMKFTEGAFRDWGYEVAKNFLAQWKLTAARGARSLRANPARESSSRMPSPTSRSSKCSRARQISMSS